MQQGKHRLANDTELGFLLDRTLPNSMHALMDRFLHTCLLINIIFQQVFVVLNMRQSIACGT